MDLSKFKESIEIKVHHISSDDTVPRHIHDAQEEVFYCFRGSGYGILENQEIELNEGETFIARAGEVHALRSDDELYVSAFLIPVDRIICHCKQVKYSDIRKAMVNGARTLEDIQEITGAGTGCGNCIPEVERILKTACGCKNISMETVINLVNNGVDTFEKVEAATEIGTECGRCKALVENIILTKR